MTGDRDIIHVSRSKALRPSPSANRKSAKGCSPSKLPVCTNSVFSSSISKAQTMYSGRSGTRGTISETLLLPVGSERKRLVGGKTPTKRTAILTFPGLVDDGIRGDQQDFLLEPTGLEGDMGIVNEASFSDGNWYRHIPESLLQPSCSEKVNKWLEESQHSSLTDLADDHTGSLDEEHDINRRESWSMATRVPDAPDCQDGNQLADIFPENIPTAQSLFEVPVDRFKGFRGLSPARLLMSYIKVMICLSVVYMGFLLRIRPGSWDYYEPPPT